MTQKKELMRLVEKANTEDRLTREEKDRLVEIYYGLLHRSSLEQLKGLKQVREIRVRFEWSPGTFSTFYAPDKTSLRRYLSPGGVSVVGMDYA